MANAPSLLKSKLDGCLVGANPIIWSNDDFSELAGDLPLETILQDMHAAGYAGSELGHAYPRTASVLAPILERHQLHLASGWHSTYLAERPLGEEMSSFQPHLTLLSSLGAKVAIVAECTRCIHGDRKAALGYGSSDRATLTDAEWKRFTVGLQQLINQARDTGLKVVYHHHMGTVIQTQEELERLLHQVPDIHLLLDPGHLSFAGVDPVVIAQKFASRIAHFHLKSVRPEIAQRARSERWSFCRAVTEGVFTIPGSGCVDFPALFKILETARYRGWLIAEAEEDPTRVPALPKARQAREYIREFAGI